MADDLERRADPEPLAYPTPGDLARAINPQTQRTAALELIDAALVEAVTTPDARVIITMPPQEGKSTRVAGDFPTWVLKRFPEWRVVVASYAQGLATRNGRAIRARITQHPELGLRIAPDNGAVTDWTLEGHSGGVLSVGIGGGLTGRPADLLIIDDPIKDRREADSETFRQNVWDWWIDVASTRLAPGAPVVVILTRWHEDDLAGRMLRGDDEEPWQLVNIPAEADHRPELGETDPLGRAPGEFMESARRNKTTNEPRTLEQWRRIKRRSGSRTWASLYQGRPSPEAGEVWQRQWWRRYEVPLWSVDADGKTHRVPADWSLSLSWDMTFKDTKGSDYVVGQVWAHKGAEARLLDQVRGRMTFTATVAAFERQAAKWPQAVAKLVEDKANGTAVIDTLRKRVPGIVPVTPTESKLARASATSPYIEAGNAQLPDDAIALFDVDGFIEEAAAFPNGAHDDQVDAASQALNRILNRAGAGSTFLEWMRRQRDDDPDAAAAA
jgi:predicted phage terminase large subunit-like protein